VLKNCQGSRRTKTKAKTKMAHFDIWISTINDLLVDNHGFILEDLPDEPFRDYHDEGLSPKDVVKIMMDNFTCTYQELLGHH